MDFNNDRFSLSVNSARGISILLVVLGHIASPLTNVIYSFHIPLFFFLSGLFLSTSDSFRLQLNKNFHRLIIPYFIFGFIGLCINVFKNFLLNRPIESFLQSISGLLWWMDIEHLRHYGFVLWFLPALFWGRLIVFYAFKKLKINNILLMIILIFFVMNISELPNLPFGIDNGIFATPWIAFGFIVNKHKINLFQANRIFMISIIFIAFCLYFFYSGAQRIDVATKNIGSSLTMMGYTFTIVFAVTYFAYRLTAEHMNSGRFGMLFDSFGKYSLTVLVFHPYSNNIAHLVVNYFLVEDLWVVKFMLSIFILIPCVLLRKAYSQSIFFRYL